jgi:predicted regulator of Ras-like GTPase activity (Roadblock/LC7/MglB family)
MSSMVQLARSQISRLPEVLALVVTDRAGNLLESSGDLDAEAAGAVYAVAADALARAGELLGLGTFDRLSLTGGTACVVAVHEQGLLAIQLDPRRPLGPIEKRLEALLRR